MKTYVTFGQIHAHHISGKTFDKDCVAVIEAPSPEAGRQVAVECFGLKFFTTYAEDAWDERNLHYFPRGYLEVN